MYCDAPNSSKRRSAQTACHQILMILTKLMAPILPFTTEEVYERIPLQKKQPTVVLEEIQPLSEQEVNQIENSELTKRYNALLKFKDRLYVQLESWRTQTGVKDSQDVLVRVFAPNETIELLKSFGEDLPNYLKISWMEFETAQEEKFLFEQSPYLKCERSRIRRPDVEVVNGIPLSKRDREVLNL
jgi:isoleucyl-tRNA synthetase